MSLKFRSSPTELGWPYQLHAETPTNIFPEYSILKVNNFDDVARDSLDEWIYFLKNFEIKSDFKAQGRREEKRATMAKLLAKEISLPDALEIVGLSAAEWAALSVMDSPL